MFRVLDDLSSVTLDCVDDVPPLSGLLGPLVGFVLRLLGLPVAFVPPVCRLLQVKMQFPSQRAPLDRGA